ncbi:MAG: PilT/PilU family type 4a pilus ATPase, partial [Rickettsiales bacterium]|nr:PilT/PilU family type 4a pilus ATPase [Rickettsiales bacterium]
QSKLTEADVRAIVDTIVTPEAVAEFDATLEYNTAFDWHGKARMRINLFRQRQNTGIVIRRIHTEIPDLKSLKLPEIYGDLIMEKRGLILVVGPTGSGKSTTLASMLGHRNQHGYGHIVTIEDPIEFIHDHNNCIVTQRDVGIDTYSFGIGLKNALRQMPDVIVIGEIRDRETMEHAIVFAETGHLCLATLHANNTNQAVERIINFFPEEKHRQVLMNLSFNLKAIVSQRLVRNIHNSRSIVCEIMLNEGLIKNMILDGRVNEIREMIEKGYGSGMKTFEQSLLELVEARVISEEVALAEADSPANLRLAMKQKGMHNYRAPASMMKPMEDVVKQQF